ncbi:hypothetical protein KR222_000289, partial [Zaprionus bogoriensis]
SGEDQYKYSDILRVFREHFIMDFDCMDVEENLRMILKKKEVDDIIKSLPTEQTYRLFWTLGNQNEEAVRKFVQNVPNYEFIMLKIMYECEHPSPDTISYIRAVDRLNNDNQKFSKYNVSRIKPYMQLQNALLELRPWKNIVIWGVLGAGKQWLALDVCSSYIVQQKMNFEIYWIDVRNCDSDESRLEKLQSFLHQIDHTFSCNSDQSVETRTERVRTELRHRLEKRQKCLIVLRNVQNKKTWEVFNIGCKILLTTRHKSVADHLSPITTTHISLDDALTPFEVESLFAKYLRNKPHELPEDRHRYPQTTNPLQLSIIAENISEGLGTLENWKNINSTEFKTYIMNSLNVLSPNDKELYKTLFIFPASAHIPIQLLQIVWQVEDPRVIVNRFEKYSLVKKQSKTISLGIYSELKLPITNESSLNMRIVNSYNIPEVFTQYDETNTIPTLDCYFYKHIGHHLSKINDKILRVRLFRMIFLDFRFLEQKIRNEKTSWAAQGCILQTLHVLKYYKEHIIDNDRHYDQLVTALLDFLPKVEEKLIRSECTSLLQLALMSEKGPVSEEALRQAQRFPHNVLFTEHGRFHQHRQIINLGKDQARHAMYLDDDFCVIALSTNELLLTDVSLQGDTTYVLSDEKDSSDVIKMSVFNNQMHLLTLHSNGSLKLWSLRPVLPSRDDLCGSLQKVQPARHCRSTRYTKCNCYEQLVNSAVRRSISSNTEQNISAFYLDEMDGRREGAMIQLHVVFVNGDICICDWDAKDERFQQSRTPILKTRQQEVRCIAKVLKLFYVLCTADCRLTVWNLRNGSNDKMRQDYAPTKDAAVAMETYIEQCNDGSRYTLLYLIHKQSVWRLKYKHADYNTIDTLEPEPLAFTDMQPAVITCGKLSHDGRYLILGTHEGVIVYDLKCSKTVLRSNVSEHIVCVDVYDLVGPYFKYIVLCGAEGKNVVNVHTLQRIDKDAITWVHHEHEDSYTSGQAQLEPDVYLRSLLKMSDDGESLYAVDSKARIHQIQMEVGHNLERRGSRGEANWSTIATPKMGVDNTITTLCVGQDDTIYAGYCNGLIINITDNRILPQQYFSEPIDYLKEINSSILIASDSSSKTLIFMLSKMNMIKLLTYTMYARLYQEHYVLLFIPSGVIYFDIRRMPESIEIQSLVGDDQLVGFDLKDNLLYLAFRDSAVTVYELYVKDDALMCQQLCREVIGNESIINYLTVSNDGELLALGFKNGNIEIYTYEKGRRLQSLYTIVHESSNEMKLRFSPCKQILVSCADQLCFWNVEFMRNNRVSPKRWSKRHNQLLPKGHEGCEEVDASPWNSTMATMEPVPKPQQLYVESKAYLWSEKRGLDKFPDKLACIRFVGNGARHFYTSLDFSQFYAIDDEGVFYHLKVLEPAR